MECTNSPHAHGPWNKGKLVGQKADRCFGLRRCVSSTSAKACYVLRLENVGRNYDSWSFASVLYPMDCVLILIKGRSRTILLGVAPTVVNDGSLHDVVSRGSVLVVMKPENAAGFDRYKAHP